MVKLAVSLLLLSLVPLCFCQLDCGNLNFGFSGVASNGANLTICAADMPQCCTQAYLDEAVEEVTDELLDGLFEELERQFERFEDVVDDLTYYFMDDDAPFFYKFFGSLPFNVTDDTQRSNIQNAFGILIRNLEILPVDTFNAADFVNILLNGLKAVAVETYPFVNATCLEQVIDSQINQEAFGALIQSISGWREAVTTLLKIAYYWEDFVDDLDREYDPENDPTFIKFVKEIVRRSFCGRCTRNIPPLCVNVCGSLARAAYSPFFTRFRAEFQQLWTVSARVVEFFSRTTDTFFRNLLVIIDGDELQEQVINTCLFSPGRRSVRLDSKVERKRHSTGGDNSEDSSSSSSSVFKFEGILAKIEAMRMSGLFMYGDEGPDVCVDNIEDRYNCTEDFTCEDGNFCTSPCNCWTGELVSENDVVAFTGVDVEDQAGNPYLPLGVDVGDLRAQAESIDFGMSVSEFLQSDDFTSTAPDGLETDDDDAAPPTVAMSMCALLLGAVLAVFL